MLYYDKREKINTINNAMDLRQDYYGNNDISFIGREKWLNVIEGVEH